MHSNAAWTGTIKQLRIYPVSNSNSSVWINEVSLAKANAFTTELQTLITTKKDTPRPFQAQPVAITLPFDLTDHLDSFGDNFVTYGAETDGDFATTNNFYATTATSGGQALLALAAPTDPVRLGMTKTGKWRKIILPTSSTDIPTLRFQVGLEDGSSSVDGVLFQVRVRDAQREFHTLFQTITTSTSWSQEHSISLKAFEG